MSKSGKKWGSEGGANSLCKTQKWVYPHIYGFGVKIAFSWIAKKCIGRFFLKSEKFDRSLLGRGISGVYTPPHYILYIYRS
jgi:hypothetical protein